ncbi:DUF2207 domain-containing protein [Vibrio sp. WJH972]
MNILRSILLFLLVSLSTCAAYADEYFVIDHYQVDIEVLENNAYNITEVIEVDFSAQRHGIFREIPLQFDDMRVELSNVSVQNHHFTVNQERDSATIRIGSVDTYVMGEQRYVITYTYDVGADALSDMDEFNHNLIGNQWGTTIANVEFKVRLPKSFNAKDINVTSGDFGSTDNSKVEWQVNGNVISGRTLKPLDHYQGLTLALPLPEGYWVGAVKHREPDWLLSLILGYPLYLLVILISAAIWYLKGRDNTLFPTVEFDPPQGMTPAEIGYVIDGRVDNEDVTSLIIYWAEKGYLEIEDDSVTGSRFKDKSLRLTRLKRLGNDAKDYEKTLFAKLFQYGDGNSVSTLDLTHKFYTTVRQVKKEITKSFTDHKQRRIYAKGTERYSRLTTVLAALPIITLLFQGFLDFMGDLVPALIFSIPFSLFLVIPSLTLGAVLSGEGKKRNIIFVAIFGGFSLVFFAILCTVEGDISLVQYGVAILASVITSIFVSIMSRRTRYGDKVLEQVLGFKEFIKTAEKDKLEALFESNPSYFYNILPYAMVFGLSDKWSTHFEGMSVEPPNWYRGASTSAMGAVAITSTLNNRFSSMTSSMTSAPSSKGTSGSSSSGGSSGGGSGGGGGGSW